MLILNRKTDETVTITDKNTGRTIVVTLIKTKGKYAYLGFEASDDFEIMRTEIMGRTCKDA